MVNVDDCTTYDYIYTYEDQPEFIDIVVLNCWKPETPRQTFFNWARNGKPIIKEIREHKTY